MKTAILGTSGSGKSTLAQFLGRREGAEVLHLDRVHFLPGWVERTPQEETVLVEQFLETHTAWVIDGNYTKTCYKRRMAEADRIVVLWFGPWTCLWRAVRRWWENRGRARDSAAPGCEEKIDWEFVRWILHDGRTAKKWAEMEALREQYPEKFVLLTNQKQMDAYKKQLEHL